jgi:hypothetical protein
VRCIEVAGAVTAYLYGDVEEPRRRRIDAHLEGCPGCRAAIDQFVTVIGLAGKRTADDGASLDALVRDRLLTTLQIPRRRQRQGSGQPAADRYAEGSDLSRTGVGSSLMDSRSSPEVDAVGRPPAPR